MTQKKYLQVSGLIFSVVAVVHIARLLMGWSVNLGEWSVPVLGSVVGALVAGYLAYSAYKLMK